MNNAVPDSLRAPFFIKEEEHISVWINRQEKYWGDIRRILEKFTFAARVVGVMQQITFLMDEISEDKVDQSPRGPVYYISNLLAKEPLFFSDDSWIGLQFSYWRDSQPDDPTSRSAFTLGFLSVLDPSLAPNAADHTISEFASGVAAARDAARPVNDAILQTLRLIEEEAKSRDLKNSEQISKFSAKIEEADIRVDLHSAHTEKTVSDIAAKQNENAERISATQSSVKQYSIALDELKRQYDAEIAGRQLGQAHVHWAERAEKHREQARMWNWIYYSSLAVLLAIGGFLLWHLDSTIEGGTQAGIDWHAFGVRAALSASIIAVAVWGVRQVLRTTRMHQHLEVDAKDRSVMIETFVQLKLNVPENAEISVLLANIYRPSTTGMVSDESEPVLPVDLLSQFIRPVKVGD